MYVLMINFRMYLKVVVHILLLTMPLTQYLSLANEITCSSLFTNEQCVFISTLIHGSQSLSSNEISNLVEQIKRNKAESMEQVQKNKIEVKMLKFQLKSQKQKTCKFVQTIEKKIKKKSSFSSEPVASIVGKHFDGKLGHLELGGGLHQV